MSTDERPRFNLWEEDWIPVLRHDGGVETLSMDTLFARPKEFSNFAGEIPTINFAIQRILSTVLRQCVPESAEPLDTWESIWKAGAFPSEDIAAYREEWLDAFDLFDAEFPFLQTPGLETAKNEYLPPSRLVVSVPSGEPHFASRFGEDAALMEPGEAACWLIHAAGYDASGIKPGALGDSRVKGGRGYPIGTGWLGSLGGFRLIGQDLFETLMLNTRFRSLADGDDLPLWEQPALTGAVSREEGSRPAGDSDLYTWPSRRIRLRSRADGTVDGVLMTNGDRLEKHGMQTREPASFFRYSPNMTKQLGSPSPVYYPRPHEPGRASWQRIDTLLAPREGVAKDQPATIQPLLLQQATALAMSGILPTGYQLLVETLGLIYGTQDAIVVDLYSDQVSFQSRLLLPENDRSRHVIEEAVKQTETLVRQLGYRIKDAREACGASNEEISSSLLTRVYFAVDPLFRRWLAEFDVDAPDASLQAWRKTLHQLLRETAEDEVRKLGPRALVGTTDKDGQEKSAIRALNMFLSQLDKALLPLREADEASSQIPTATTKGLSADD